MKKFLFLALFFVFISSSAHANAAFEKMAESHVKVLVDKAISVISNEDKKPETIKSQFYSLLSEYFDVPTIGRFALGRYWKSVSDDQKEEYIDLFRTMIVEIYASRFEGYTNEKVEIVSSRSLNKRDVLVSSQLVFADNRAPIPLEWRVRNVDGQPKIIDLVVEGVSMSVTQRSDFNSVMQRADGNVNELLNKMREKYVK